MLRFIYSSIFIPIASALMKVINPKFKAREETCEKLINNLEKHSLTNNSAIRYWFHAASMGEFEQAKPIIERIKQIQPDSFVFVTFFSPSGYDNQKNYKFADAIAYMPIDSAKNAKRIIDIIQPDKAIFIRYEIWMNHLLELKKRNVPVYLVNASRPLHLILNFYYKKVFQLFEKIFVMNARETRYFKDIIGENKVYTLSDTRFDRIMERVNANRENPLFDKRLFGDNFVLVIGSSWQPDEDIILPAVEKINSEAGRNISLVVVPHEPTPEHLAQLSERSKNYVLLSELEKNQEKYIDSISRQGKIIIVDSIGKLLRIYANADAAYVGGAFGVGIHSVTEPAGYGLPILCGAKKYDNSPDAVEMVKIGALKPLANADEVYNYLKKILDDTEFYRETARKAGNYVSENAGATDKFLSEIK